MIHSNSYFCLLLSLSLQNLSYVEKNRLNKFKRRINNYDKRNVWITILCSEILNFKRIVKVFLRHCMCTSIIKVQGKPDVNVGH